MSKIELPTITSGYNLSTINNNFQKIEDALNEEVLYRKGYVGEPNEMQTNLDMNGKEILNVSVGSSPGSLATKGYVDQEIAEERSYVDQQLALVDVELDTKYDKSGGPVYGDVQMQGYHISGLPNATQPSQPATYAQLLQVEAPGDSLLRNELAAAGGAGLIGGVAQPVTSPEFAGGADPTGAADSTAAFLAAAASQKKIFIPKGSYKILEDIVSDPLTSWEMEMGASFTGSFRLRQAPWLAGANEQIFHYLERMSRNTFIGPTDGIGVFGTAHNDGAGSAGAAIGVAGLGYNDNTVGPGGGAWALYGTAIRNAGTTGPTHGMELDIANRGNEREIYPFNMFSSGQTHGIWLGSGGELGGVGENGGVPLNSASVAIGIVSNDGNPTKTARFLKGIVFQSDSLKGTDGVTGEGIAIALANRHTMQWYGTSNERLGAVTCQGTDASKALRINLSDNGALFQKNTGGQTQFSIEAITGTPANFPVVRSATAGNPVQLAASGSDANVDLLLVPKGTGKLNVSADLAPQSANTYTVGTSLRPWAGGFTQTAFTVTSDERFKTSPLEITDAMLDAAAEVDWVQYQYLDRVEAKGSDGARWHFGAVAQRYVEAFQRHGLDAHDFGFICYDEWDASPAVINTIPAVLDDDGNEIEPERTEVASEAIEAGSRYGIRYEEALALEAALQRRNYQRLLSRVEALEATNG